jgi:hypothetical protein
MADRAWRIAVHESVHCVAGRLLGLPCSGAGLEPTPLAEQRPDKVALAKRLARRKPKGGKLSLRAISAALAAQGHLNEGGKPFAAKSVASMLAS